MIDLQTGKYYKSIKEMCVEAGLEYKDNTCSRKVHSAPSDGHKCVYQRPLGISERPLIINQLPLY